MKYRSPYDVPCEAEAYASALLANLVRVICSVLACSVLPGIGLLLLITVSTFLVQQSWPDPASVGVSGLAAVSVGCTRYFLSGDSEECAQ